MQILDLVQGSPEWLAHRRAHFNASDAPAMMGCSPYKTRAQLLRELYTGVAPEADAGQQRRFDNGHRVEALARPLAEEFIGAELYPVTGTRGRYSASFDGLTLDESEGFEHKALNAEIDAAFDDMQTIAPEHRETDGCRSLPLHHRVQMEQQLMISGAQRILFMASAWTADDELIEERHCWYYPDLTLRQQILDGWAQFERDLAAYVVPDSPEPAPVGKAPETLPALLVQVTGAVTASNLDEFKAVALGAIRSVNRTLKTDADFADAEKAVKWCADVESRLKAAKEHALSQTADIDRLFKALDDISAEARTVRLDLDKLVTRRKTEVKEEAVAAARRKMDEHIRTLEAELAPFRLPAIHTDFAGAIKGLKSVASMQDKLGSLVATGMIAADAAARVIRTNAATFRDRAQGMEFLFADLGQLISKAPDDFGNLLDARIATHRAAEERRAREKAEAEAREAERRRLQAEEDARVAALARESAQAAAAASARIVAAAPAEPVNVYGPEHLAPNPAPGLAFDSRGVLAPIALSTPSVDEPATLLIGTIAARLGFTLRADFIGDCLGIAPAGRQGSAVLYRESDFRRICVALQLHVARAQSAAERAPAAAECAA